MKMCRNVYQPATCGSPAFCSNRLNGMSPPPSLKILFLTVHGIVYCFSIFRHQFMTARLGFSLEQYGDVQALMALSSVVGTPFWSAAADSLGRHRLVLACLCAATAGCFSLLALAEREQFFVPAALLTLYAFLSSGLAPLVDYIALSSLGADRRHLYGRLRIWGTLSFGFTALLVGQCLDAVGSMLPLFYIVPVFAAASILSIAATALPLQVDASHSEPEKHTEIKAAAFLDATTTVRLARLFSHPTFCILLGIVFMTGCVRSVSTLFLSAHWSQQLGLSRTQIGIASNFAVASEVAIFSIAPWLLSRVGVHWLLILAQLAGAVRSWAYCSLPSDPSHASSVYAIELLKGITFGFTHLAGVKIASDSAPAGTEATAQALYTIAYSQVPAVATALVGTRLKPNVLLIATGVVASLSLLVSAIVLAAIGNLQCWRQGSVITYAAVAPQTSTEPSPQPQPCDNMDSTPRRASTRPLRRPIQK